MEIDIRAAARLRGSAGAQAAVRPIVEALCRSDADLATVRVVGDWNQWDGRHGWHLQLCRRRPAAGGDTAPVWLLHGVRSGQPRDL